MENARIQKAKWTAGARPVTPAEELKPVPQVVTGGAPANVPAANSGVADPVRGSVWWWWW